MFVKVLIVCLVLCSVEVLGGSKKKQSPEVRALLRKCDELRLRLECQERNATLQNNYDWQDAQEKLAAAIDSLKTAVYGNKGHICCLVAKPKLSEIQKRVKDAKSCYKKLDLKICREDLKTVRDFAPDIDKMPDFMIEEYPEARDGAIALVEMELDHVEKNCTASLENNTAERKECFSKHVEEVKTESAKTVDEINNCLNPTTTTTEASARDNSNESDESGSSKNSSGSDESENSKEDESSEQEKSGENASEGSNDGGDAKPEHPITDGNENPSEDPKEEDHNNGTDKNKDTTGDATTEDGKDVDQQVTKVTDKAPDTTGDATTEGGKDVDQQVTKVTDKAPGTTGDATTEGGKDVDQQVTKVTDKAPDNTGDATNEGGKDVDQQVTKVTDKAPDNTGDATNEDGKDAEENNKVDKEANKTNNKEETHPNEEVPEDNVDINANEIDKVDEDEVE